MCEVRTASRGYAKFSVHISSVQLESTLLDFSAMCGVCAASKECRAQLSISVGQTSAAFCAVRVEMQCNAMCVQYSAVQCSVLGTVQCTEYSAVY